MGLSSEHEEVKAFLRTAVLVSFQWPRLKGTFDVGDLIINQSGAY